MAFRLRRRPYFPIRGWLGILALLGTGCPPPVATTREIDIGGLALLYGEGPNTLVNHDYTFYAGNPVESMSLTLELDDLSPSCPLQVVSGGGTAMQAITVGGTLTTVSVPGNVLTLRATCASADPPPRVSVLTMTLQQRGTVLPEPARSPADSVSSFPLRLNQPVELAFSAGTVMSYFFTLENADGKDLDFVLDGLPGGQVAIGDEASGFVLGAENAVEVVDGGFKSLRFTGRDTLLLTVRNATAAAGIARFSVNEVRDLRPLRVRYMMSPGLVPNLPGIPQEALAAFRDPDPQLRASMQLVCRSLYQASAGRIRPSGTINYRTPRVRSEEGEDVRVYPFPTEQLAQAVPAFQDVQASRALVGFDLLDPGGASGAALSVARQILRIRHGLPDEKDTCPNSAMGGSLAGWLCWDRNHNPLGRSGASPDSAWKRLSGSLGIPNPATTPPLILRTRTDIRFPQEFEVAN